MFKTPQKTQVNAESEIISFTGKKQLYTQIKYRKVQFDEHPCFIVKAYCPRSL